MEIEGNGTAFDVLAILCSLLNKEEERKCAIEWCSAGKKHIQAFGKKYKDFVSIIQRSSLNEYRLNKEDIAFLNNELEQMQQDVQNNKEDIYRLAIEVEHALEDYFEWQNRGALYEMEPLNANVNDTGIIIYPCPAPQWNQNKSERNRERIWNTDFAKYMMIRCNDVLPFKFVAFYWNDTGLLKETENGWTLSIALAPVMDCAHLLKEQHDTYTGYVAEVKGIESESEVTTKVLRIFDEIFAKEYGIIVFPEGLGNEEIVNAIKMRMRRRPEYCTFVLLPTVCENGRNLLTVLGPGGIDCLTQGKNSPFILIDDNGDAYREDLEYDRELRLLITKELGIVAFAICASLLDPEVYRTLTGIGKVNTIICPSYSPGVNAFKDTLYKGIPLKLLQLYVNSCSAKTISRSGTVSGEVAMVQLPFVKEELPVKTFERTCNGQCKGSTCYFDITISYQNDTFFIEGIHKCA